MNRRIGISLAAFALIALSACGGKVAQSGATFGSGSEEENGAGSDASQPDEAGVSFACGSSTCDASTQVCEHVEGGVAPGVDFYSCIAIPTECTGSVSCACVVDALRGRGAGQCTATGNGLVVQIDVP